MLVGTPAAPSAAGQSKPSTWQSDDLVYYRSDQGHMIRREGPGNDTLVFPKTNRHVHNITTLRWAKAFAKSPKLIDT